MTQVNIPFSPEMALAALRGVKTMTSRNKKYGKEGDTFVIEPPGSYKGGLEAKTFRITSIESHKLGMVAAVFYDLEGFDSMHSFTQTWKSLHPRKGYDPEHEVWVHRFERVQ